MASISAEVRYSRQRTEALVTRFGRTFPLVLSALIVLRTFRGAEDPLGEGSVAAVLDRSNLELEHRYALRDIGIEEFLRNRHAGLAGRKLDAEHPQRTDRLFILGLNNDFPCNFSDRVGIGN